MVRGLSPRVRGNRTLHYSHRTWRRPIPACAGEPTAGTQHDRRSRAYPRVCGGTRASYASVDHTRGLSPRVRGTAAAAARAVASWGLSPRVRGNQTSANPDTAGSGPIPACAGEPDGATADNTVIRAYPRVCGGAGLRRSTRPSVSGLSPRVRGTLSEAGLDGASAGLSPRVRGNHCLRSRTHDQNGPIPACAGEPYLRGTRSRTCGAYPRVCGGTSSERRITLRRSGLSPRVRGTARIGVESDPPTGLSPRVRGTVD